MSNTLFSKCVLICFSLICRAPPSPFPSNFHQMIHIQRHNYCDMSSFSDGWTLLWSLFSEILFVSNIHVLGICMRWCWCCGIPLTTTSQSRISRYLNFFMLPVVSHAVGHPPIQELQQGVQVGSSLTVQ